MAIQHEVELGSLCKHSEISNSLKPIVTVAGCRESLPARGMKILIGDGSGASTYATCEMPNWSRRASSPKGQSDP